MINLLGNGKGGSVKITLEIIQAWQAEAVRAQSMAEANNYRNNALARYPQLLLVVEQLLSDPDTMRRESALDSWRQFGIRQQLMLRAALGLWGYTADGSCVVCGAKDGDPHPDSCIVFQAQLLARENWPAEEYPAHGVS